MEAKFIERIREAGGFYEFDYSDPADAAFVLESLGGEENLKQNYPLVYEAFLSSAKRDSNKKRSNAAEVTKVGMHIDTMYREKCDEGKQMVKVTASGLLGDPSFQASDAASGKSARPWISGNLLATVYNYKNPAECYFTNSFSFKQRNNFQYEYGTEELSPKAAEGCASVILLHALDPDGQLKTYSDSRPPLNVCINVIRQFHVEHPQSPNGNNPIIMLYGRTRKQNEGYVNADYYNDGPGEYYNNTPQNGSLKTIMPLKGTIKLAEDCTFPKTGVFHKPGPNDPYPYDRLIRSTMAVGQIQVSAMYEDLDDSKAYEVLAKCFTTDMSGMYPTIYFDLTRDGGHNWYSDTKGVGQWTNNALTYELTAGFVLDIIDPKGLPLSAQFSITSKPIDEMKGKQYYTSDSYQVYVPPVTVHWGCLAKGTLIRLATGTYKKVEDLKIKDQAVTSSGKIATYTGSVIGHEDKLFSIKAAGGKVMLTGGHPMLLGDGTAKAAGLVKAGDRLMTLNGDSEVLEVQEVDYNDFVYSPIFQESTEDGLFILCNGFYCGDYNSQNKPPRSDNILTGNMKALAAQFEAVTRSSFQAVTVPAAKAADSVEAG